MSTIIYTIWIVIRLVCSSDVYEIENGTIFISTNGNDTDTCGTFLNPCGTFYFASINSTYSRGDDRYGKDFYVIDGQNSVQIQKYINNMKTTNNTIYFHPCLPSQTICVGAWEKCKIMFNASLIHSMNDWYPEVCDDEYLYSKLFASAPFIKSGHGNYFDGNYNYNVGDTIFVNLIIDKYSNKKIKSSNLSLAHSPWAMFGSLVECYNCSFINISFYCLQSTNSYTGHDYTLVAYSNFLINIQQLILVDVIISDVYITCDSISAMFQFIVHHLSGTYDDLQLSNVYMSNIWSTYSVFVTDSMSISVTDSVFSNINTQSDIFGEQERGNFRINITNTNFSYINTAIYVSFQNKIDYANPTEIYIEDVNFLISNTLFYGEENSLIVVDTISYVQYNNINVIY
eukprot:551246_1